VRNISSKQFLKELYREIRDDNVFNGAAALAFYLMLAIFPAAIFLLTLLPYLPVPDLSKVVLDLLRQVMPGETAGLFIGVLQDVMKERRGDLLSFGLLFSLWSASNGLHAIMQQLNITYDVKESRPFWKTRCIAILLMLLFIVLSGSALALIVAGGNMQDLVASALGHDHTLLAFFAIFRWVVILLLLLLGFAVVYYFGPDVEQQFRFITPGSVTGTILLLLTSLAFSLYVAGFNNYNATYGSLGAVIILLLWLYVTGLVILIGSEINALIEHYATHSKKKGEKRQPSD